MLTPFGIAVRKLRLDRGLKLRDMALCLGLTSAFVSAIETGRKPIPRDYIDSIAQTFSLSEQETQALKHAEDESRTTVKVDSLKAADRALIASLARKVNELPPGELDIIRELLGRYRAPSSLDLPPLHNTRRLARASEQIRLARGSKPALERGFAFDAEHRFSFRVPPLSARQIEAQADRCRALFLSKEQIWFPIVEVLELAIPRIIPDFNLEIYSSDEITVEGALLPRSSTIIVHEDLYDEACAGMARARFTFCHEFGHFILHKVLKATLDTLKRRGHRLYEDSEWQADRFASSLLAARVHSTGFRSIEQLSSKCGISRAAATARWSQLRDSRDEVRLEACQETSSSQSIEVTSEFSRTHSENKESRIPTAETEILATELDMIGRATAEANIPQPLRQLLLQHISYLTWAIRNSDGMTIEGIRAAFTPSALPVIDEADEEKIATHADTQSLQKRLLTVTQKAMKALNLVDLGLKKANDIKHHIDDLFK